MVTLPTRINLAIANKCFVRCPGCYNYFNNGDLNLEKMIASIKVFYDLGIEMITISGGDPLTLKQIIPFIKELRKLSLKRLKIDTVGTLFINDRYDDLLFELLSLVDCIALPLDGWNNEIFSSFRFGRKNILDESITVIKKINSILIDKKILINTVAHKGNIHGLRMIHDIIQPYGNIFLWRIFQYVDSDQTSEYYNKMYKLSDAKFLKAKDDFLSNIENPNFIIDFKLKKDRLNKYFLINSAGIAWTLDKKLKAIDFGCIYDNEVNVLQEFSNYIKD